MLILIPSLFILVKIISNDVLKMYVHRFREMNYSSRHHSLIFTNVPNNTYFQSKQLQENVHAFK